MVLKFPDVSRVIIKMYVQLANLAQWVVLTLGHCRYIPYNSTHQYLPKISF